MFLNVSELAKVDSAKLATDWKIADYTNGALSGPGVVKSNGETIRMPARELPGLPGFFGGSASFNQTTPEGTLVPVSSQLTEIVSVGNPVLKPKYFRTTENPGKTLDVPNVFPYNRRTVFWKHNGYTTQTVNIYVSKLVCQKCYSTCYGSCWGGNLPSPQRDPYEVAIVDEGQACPGGSTILLSSRVCVPLSFFPWMYCRISCYSYYNCDPYPCEPSVDCNCALQDANTSYNVAQTRYQKFFWAFENWYQHSNATVDGTFPP